MRIGHKGLALLKRFEGFRARRYWDPYGKVWTQGYGETHGTDSTAWTEKHASERLEHRVNNDYLPAVAAAAHRYKLDLDQDEIDALASFVYNLGAGALAEGSSVGSSMRNALRSRNRWRIGRAFLLYASSGGVKLLGLLRRRRAERKLFLTRARNLRRWRRELTKIRTVVRVRFRNDWSKTPKRKARADALKTAIKKNTPKE